MTDLSKFDDLVVAGRTYIPLLQLDADGRHVESKVRVDPARAVDLRGRPRQYEYRVVKPYLCSDCGALTFDPQLHNAAHDGPSCEVCGCSTDNSCLGGCWWVEDRLCSACAADPTNVVEAGEG